MPIFTVFNVDKASWVSSNVVIGIYHSYIIAAGGVKISNGRNGQTSSTEGTDPSGQHPVVLFLSVAK